VKRWFRGPWLWVVLFAILILVVLEAISSRNGAKDIATSQMVSYINNNEIKDITFVDGDQVVKATLKDGSEVQSHWLQEQGVKMLSSVQQNDTGVTYNVEVPQPSIIWTFISSFLPILLIILFFLFMMNSLQGGGGRVMQFAKSKAKVVSKDTPKTTFADVAGVDEAIEELGEIKEFLQQPAKFQAVGAKIPKGVLLYGPPGTGKTLLARAVAGEAGVPFYSISGSDFVEMFVGVGASRVRDLFEQAKENAPAIVFIDEIDAVGRHRGAGLGGGHDEREQTLNQLLVEMDGFDVRGGVILIAATNRPDVLDPALLRPGRFDRMVAVAAPNMDGRHKILQVHSRGKPIASGVDLLAVARRTPGFTGADLANVLNEAALLTARQDKKLIDDRMLDEAIDRVSMGPQRHSHIMSEQEKLMTAYHEGGHALVAAALPGTDPVAKITILPRGRALGFTQVLPEADKSSVSRNDLLNQLAYALGGLAAEQLIFHDPTTGSSNDIDKATKVARAMVMSYGMSDRLGAVKFGEENAEPFLGRDIGHTRNYSEEIAAIIDEEINKLLTNAHQEAFDILVTNRNVLDRLVTELLEHETIDRKGLDHIFADVQMRPERPAWTGSDTRTPSDIPPVDIPAAARMNGRPEPQPEITVSPGSESGAPPPTSGPPGPPPPPPTGGPPSGPPGSPRRVDHQHGPDVQD
jgi:cell division protease FtsH